jgi:hypothetical protein
MSEAMNITCGVPQVSILGPLLFLCYVNDMNISISKKYKIILYADDSAILYSHKDSDVICNVLGKGLENGGKWLVDYKLSLYLFKKSVLFSVLRGNYQNLSILKYTVTITPYNLSHQ